MADGEQEAPAAVPAGSRRLRTGKMPVSRRTPARAIRSQSPIAVLKWSSAHIL